MAPTAYLYSKHLVLGWAEPGSHHALIKRTVHSKIKCDLIERVLDTDSNEPPLASIRELELSPKHDTKGTWSTSRDNRWRAYAYCLGLELPMFRMLSLLLALLILYVPEKHLFGVFLVKKDCSAHDKDGRRTGCSKTSFYSSPIERRLRNACFPTECYEL